MRKHVRRVTRVTPGTNDSPPAPPPPERVEAEITPPHGWRPGELLNIRNAGHCYVVTRWPAEYDPQQPQNAMIFDNPARCQDFVSRWYARQHHDPRAR